ncbi:hypothetical protein VNO80_06815 [Phaseolus coccineus]|uniref:Uncharacterized protein n=1 Tax=Phaseolus coccineus TaxID=3886 RepID=A0AAN9NMF7_PHACN
MVTITMFPEHFWDPKIGTLFSCSTKFSSAEFNEFQEIPKKYSVGKRRLLLLKHVGKGLAAYALLGALWLYIENSSLGLGKQKPRLKEHKEALKDFIGKGKMWKLISCG